MSASSVPLLFFAKSRELAGTAEAHLDRPSPSAQTHIRCADLLLHICQRHNLLSIKDNVILAVNGEYCSNADELIEWSGVTEVAVIPPISGG